MATGAAVGALEPAGNAIAVRHARGATRASAVVTCAGAWADRLAVACGAPADPRIVPFRGAYLRLRPERRDLVRANIYPVPDPDLPFLGMHLTRGIDGEVLLGPSALMVGARDAYRLGGCARATSRETLAWPGPGGSPPALAHGVGEARTSGQPALFVERAAPVRPELQGATCLPGPAGIRAQAARAATARWSTTSSSTAPSGRSTSATPPRPPPPRRSRSPA